MLQKHVLFVIKLVTIQQWTFHDLPTHLWSFIRGFIKGFKPKKSLKVYWWINASLMMNKTCFSHQNGCHLDVQLRYTTQTNRTFAGWELYSEKWDMNPHLPLHRKLLPFCVCALWHASKHWWLIVYYLITINFRDTLILP